MRHIIDLCGPNDDLDVIIADRKLDGYDLVWSTRPAMTDRVVVEDRAGALDGQVLKRIILVFQKD